MAHNANVLWPNPAFDMLLTLEEVTPAYPRAKFSPQQEAFPSFALFVLVDINSSNKSN